MRRFLIIALLTILLIAVPQKATGDLSVSRELVEEVETTLEEPTEIPRDIAKTVDDVITLAEKQLSDNTPTSVDSEDSSIAPSHSSSPQPQPSEQKSPSEKPSRQERSQRFEERDVFALPNNMSMLNNESSNPSESDEPDEVEVTETEVKVEKRVVTRLFDSVPWWIYLIMSILSAITAWAIVKTGFARATADRAMARLGYYRRIKKLHEEDMVKHGVNDQFKKKR